MKYPNFFLIGAPKCATTSIYDLLAVHPQIFCPSIKEPGFYTRDDVVEPFRSSVPHLRSERDYLKIFNGAGPEHKVLCDGSTSYLRDPTALAEIAHKYPDARILAVARDPVDLVSSYHLFLRHEGWEDLETLKEAWAAQDARSEGLRVPVGARRRSSVNYREVAMQGKHIDRAMAIFGNRLKVLVFSDLMKDSEAQVREIQSFLDLPQFDLGPLPAANSARRAKLAWVNRLIKNPPPPLSNLRNLLKKQMSVSSLGVRSWVEQRNSQRVQRVVDPDLQHQMRDFFYSDVQRLSDLLHRDLHAEWGWR